MLAFPRCSSILFLFSLFLSFSLPGLEYGTVSLPVSLIFFPLSTLPLEPFHRPIPGTPWKKPATFILSQHKSAMFHSAVSCGAKQGNNSTWSQHSWQGAHLGIFTFICFPSHSFFFFYCASPQCWQWPGLMYCPMRTMTMGDEARWVVRVSSAYPQLEDTVCDQH